MEGSTIEKCPYCGGEELKDCGLESHTGVYLSGGAFRSVEMRAVVCRNCGKVAYLYCKDPEKLYPIKDRRKK